MNLLKNFIKEEEGMGTVEVVLILVVLVSIALIFRNTILGIVRNILNPLKTDIENNSGVVTQ